MRRRAINTKQHELVNLHTGKHKQIHESSRYAYDLRRRRALKDPEQVMSIIVDCTKRVIPKVAHAFTAWSSYDSEMQFQIIGTIAHGLGHMLHVWPEKMYAKDSAAVIDIIQATIFKAQQQYSRYFENHITLETTSYSN